MTNGTVVRLVSDKGFGFIRSESGSEFFFHRSACERGEFEQMREGQNVKFEAGDGPKGPRAERVQPA